MKLLNKPRAAYEALGRGNVSRREVTTRNGEEYKLEVVYYFNRSGFVHYAELHQGGRVIGNSKIQYYNRSWERYTGQSAMRLAAERALKLGNITPDQYNSLYEALS